MVIYVDMTLTEAKALLATFVSNTPQRLDQLRQRSAASGGPSPEDLDLGPASLDRLWAWATPQFAWRDGYDPPPDHEPGPRHPARPLEPDDQLPEWFDPRALDWWRFSADTLWLIDGLARYLAESVIAHVPTAHWTVGRARTRSYAFQNHIVMDGIPFGDQVEPMWSVTILVSRALQPDSIYQRGARSLREVDDIWTSPPPRP